MNLEEAIEINKAYLRGDEPDYAPDLPAAIRLGIASMEIVKEQGFEYYLFPEMPLPGETED
ncbi:hypothetical protein ES703_09970 [subsurface metagenome]